MWHIPINAGECSLLYAAESFDQFEGLLQLFEKLYNEENDDWWDKLANELEFSYNTEDYSFGSGEYDVDTGYDEEYEEDSPYATEEQQAYRGKQL